MGSNDVRSDAVRRLASLLEHFDCTVKFAKTNIYQNRPDLILSKDGETIAIEISNSPLTVTKVQRLGNLPVDRIIIGIAKNRLFSTDSRVVSYIAKHDNITVYQFDKIEDIIYCING